LKDAVIPVPDDVVKQVRIGRQPNSRTRVVFDLKGNGARYSVYTLYDPYRIVRGLRAKASGLTGHCESSRCGQHRASPAHE
jgi:hypothetical protein